jgi:hypothetical protein
MTERLGIVNPAPAEEPQQCAGRPPTAAHGRATVPVEQEYDFVNVDAGVD